MDIAARWSEVQEFLIMGGPAIWAIAALSVLTVALILWKVWRLMLMGAWSGRHTEAAVRLWEAGDAAGARSTLGARQSLRAIVARRAIEVQLDDSYDDTQSREEIQRVAKNQLARARTGMRALDLIATIAPLLGLLGTVLGMIAAFQTLQEAGSRADPAALAGGIWEALLTTAAGMAVAIPAGIALTWFESVTDRAQGDMEDAVTRIMLRKPARSERALAAAAE
ncbi:MotA/TolQ/ExbB proton channel family protein [Rhodalgimonas zhirmunskyi]|uniref:MotA/TolQ/ExbB proton channel family protein n=1 Tax=Rhodalgimonas zhirmunskyi TaxID=2964767 RepID=A0AAJ1X6F5_9RHOB|nr:MotA/TolQ/ExbB proton channel family protein [Rhodoalgimonas zhirmunskyi]MDQ2093382.1 MotA/TolQ/ExbB proton channel family protein [Rhodoalgimonas zhirmunskyi]